MKAITIALNTALLAVVAWLLIEKGVAEEKLWLIALFIAAPLSTLISAYLERGRSWLSLYWKRRALEEQQRISAMSKETGTSNRA